MSYRGHERDEKIADLWEIIRILHAIIYRYRVLWQENVKAIKDECIFGEGLQSITVENKDSQQGVFKTQAWLSEAQWVMEAENWWVREENWYFKQ